ncbi:MULTISPECIES: class I SAM-dependent methyltransferase [Acidianus]|nr:MULTISPECIES: class I SAM-dependent methyltransferase [Acidianus]NON61446.1 class I SAM-dependent methyltransferase [Acidianus sp. RZ1]
MEVFKDPKGYINWYFNHKEIYDSERELVKSLNLENCIDIGSGPSVFHDALKGRTISVDISILMLKEADPEEDKVQADAMHLPFRDNSMPCAFVSVAICFLESPEKLIREMERISSKEIGVCIVPKDSSWGKFYQQLGEKGHKYYSIAHFISKEELLSALKDFNLVEIKSTLHFAPLEDAKYEEPKNDPFGGFLCVKGIKKNHLGFP